MYQFWNKYKEALQSDWFRVDQQFFERQNHWVGFAEESPDVGLCADLDKGVIDIFVLRRRKNGKWKKVLDIRMRKHTMDELALYYKIALQVAVLHDDRTGK